MILRSLSSQHLHHAYARSFDAVIVILLGIRGINVLTLLEIYFLYIYVIMGRKLRLQIKVKDAFGEK
jgi:hypothetical protein